MLFKLFKNGYTFKPLGDPEYFSHTSLQTALDLLDAQPGKEYKIGLDKLQITTTEGLVNIQRICQGRFNLDIELLDVPGVLSGFWYVRDTVGNVIYSCPLIY